MDATEKMLSISTKIDEKINQLISDLLILYRDELLLEDCTYIIPAVWGAIKNGQLDTTQMEINKKIKNTRDKIISTMTIEKLNDPQKFAIKYLINRTIISTTTYMVEMGKSKLTGNETSNENWMKNLKPMGNG